MRLSSVQSLLSLQMLSSGVCTHALSTQVSIVHSKGSLLTHGSPAWTEHEPSAQVSGPLQKLPSSQELLLLVFTQPVAGSHESVMQTLLLLQTGGVPGWQIPEPQTSSPLHLVVSAQEVPSGCLASAEQSALVPVQKSSTSQTPAAPLQSWELGANWSAGQSLLMPSQLSGTSQTPADGRQTSVLLASVGHAAPEPVQKSSTSHTPAASLQSCVLGANPSAGHSVELPVQTSATSHTSAAARQVAPALPAGNWQ